MDAINLDYITINEGVKRIGDEAFKNSCLRNITLPSTIEFIGERAFADLGFLSEINANANNTHYKSIDGNLYSYDGTVFIAYSHYKPEPTTFTIPDGVTTIASSAFSPWVFGTKLQHIIVPDSVTSIGLDGLKNSMLTSITLDFEGNWYKTTSEDEWKNKTGGTKVELNSENVKEEITSAFGYYWYKIQP